jgi:uncharacterized protein YndB with AHSA1/START domain
MASARHEVVINAPPMKVWGLLGNVTKWPAWNKHVSKGSMMQGEEFYPGSTFQYVYDGKPLAGTITLIERPKALAWRAGNARVSFRVEPTGDKTKVIGEYEVNGFMINLRKAKSEQEAQQVAAGWVAALKEGVEKAG